MALSDWVDKLGASAFSLVTSPKYAGAKALKIDCSNCAASKKILGISEGASPKAGVFKSQIYLQLPAEWQQVYSLWILFRYVDLNNYFFFKLRCEEVPRIDIFFGKMVAGSPSSSRIINIDGAEYFNCWTEWEFRVCKLGSNIQGEVYRAGGLLGTHAVAESFPDGGAIGFGHGDQETWSKDIFLDETYIYY